MRSSLNLNVNRMWSFHSRLQGSAHPGAQSAAAHPGTLAVTLPEAGGKGVASYFVKLECSNTKNNCVSPLVSSLHHAWRCVFTSPLSTLAHPSLPLHWTVQRSRRCYLCRPVASNIFLGKQGMLNGDQASRQEGATGTTLHQPRKRAPGHVWCVASNEGGTKDRTQGAGSRQKQTTACGTG